MIARAENTVYCRLMRRCEGFVEDQKHRTSKTSIENIEKVHLFVFMRNSNHSVRLNMSYQNPLKIANKLFKDSQQIIEKITMNSKKITKELKKPIDFFKNILKNFNSLSNLSFKFLFCAICNFVIGEHNLPTYQQINMKSMSSPRNSNDLN